MANRGAHDADTQGPKVGDYHLQFGPEVYEHTRRVYQQWGIPISEADYRRIDRDERYRRRAEQKEQTLQGAAPSPEPQVVDPFVSPLASPLGSPAESENGEGADFGFDNLFEQPEPNQQAPPMATQADIDAATRRLGDQLRDEMKSLKTPGIPPTPLPKYRGRADTRTFKEYLDVFYDVALSYDWNEARKCQMLGSALEGEAKAAYQTIPDGDKTSWKKLVEALGKKLTFQDNVPHMRQRLQNRTQKPHESIAEYALDIRYLVEKAFPESHSYTAQQKKENEIDYFLRGLRPQIKEQLIRRDTPNTLEDAIDLARKEEQIQLDIRRDYSDRAQLVASVRTDEELQAAANRMERGIEKGFEKVIHKLDKLSIKESAEQPEPKANKERARSTSPPKREWYNSGVTQNTAWTQPMHLQPQLVIPATVAAITTAPQTVTNQPTEPPQWFRDWETKQRYKQQQNSATYQTGSWAPRTGFRGIKSRGFSRGGFQRGPPGNFRDQRPPYRNEGS